MTFVFVWTSSTESVDLPEDYWFISSNYYKDFYTKLSCNHKVVVCMLSTKKDRQTYVEGGVQYELFPIEGGKPPREEYSYQMLQFINQLKPHIVTIYLMNRKQTELCLKKQLPNSLYVLHTSSARTSGITIEWLNSSEGKIDLIICHNSIVKQKLMLNLRKDYKIIMSPSGVDTSQFIPGSQPKVFDCIWVGINRSLTQQQGTNKNLGFVIEIMKGLEANFLIVGGGRLMNSLVEQVKQANLAKKVFFTGYISHNNIVDLLQKSKIFVLPSLSDAAPRTVSEAMACSLPVVSLDHCIGTEDQIQHYINGFRVLGAQDCIEKLNLLLRKAELRKTYGTESRRICLTNFNAKKQIKKLVGIYEKLLSINKKGAVCKLENYLVDH